MLTKEQITIIRKKRDTECFTIVNRSVLWHKRLNSQQKRELEAWYQAWLDAPETGIIPQAPSWVNNKTKSEEILI